MDGKEGYIKYFEKVWSKNKARGLAAQIKFEKEMQNGEFRKHKDKLIHGCWIISPKLHDSHKFRFCVFVHDELLKKTNIVPDRCSITVDRRILPNESIEDAKDEIEKILKQLSKEDPRLKTNLKIIVSRKGAITNPEESIVKFSKEASEQVLGKDVEVTGSSATSDMEVFVNQDNIPTVLLGPGSLGMAHITDESVEVNQVVDAAKIFSLVALKALG